MHAILPRAVAALTLAAALLAGCDPGRTTTPAPSAPGPSLTAVPGGPTPVIGPTVGPPTTTDTEFGPIWDALPPSFPIPPGAVPIEAQGPASGSFALGTTPALATEIVSAGFVRAGWSVDVASPLEDGTVVIDATGPDEGCKTEVRLTPRSGTVSMSVLYGASCPFT